MNILIAPDSFKECLSAKDVARSMALGIRNVIPDANIKELPISDGGEGILDVLLASIGGRLINVNVFDPLLKTMDAQYGILNDNKTAIIELARASGLELVKENERNIMIASTCGTGQLIKDALNKGCTKIIIGIGGSATNDGGMGMMRALGARFLDKDGNDLPEGGGALNTLETIDLSHMDKSLQQIEVWVACDVSNTLTGSHGASLVYGAQKGGTKEELEHLDKNLAHYASIIKTDLKIDLLNIPGSGAAGGTGAALMAFMNGKLMNGIDLILEILGFEEAVQQTDLIITGEGKIDSQTLHGKTISGIARLAKKYEVPVIAIAGRLGTETEGLYDLGVTSIHSITNGPIALKEAIDNASYLIQECVDNVMRIIKQFKIDRL